MLTDLAEETKGDGIYISILLVIVNFFNMILH